MKPATVAIATPFPGVVLAGGLSQRMGRDKAHVLLGGVPLLSRVVARLQPQTSGLGINANAAAALALPEGQSFPGRIPVFPDAVPGRLGPLSGVLSAMRHTLRAASHPTHVATVPTDTPFFPLDLVARLAAGLATREAIAIAVSGGTMHPVFGLWPVALADDLEAWLLSDDKRRVRDFIAGHPTVAVDFPLLQISGASLDPFLNLNTPDDLERAERLLALMDEGAP